jgi:hypothetical protein
MTGSILIMAAHAASATVVIQGTNSADVIDVSGSTEPHEIYGRGGADTIKGSMADDLIDGGSSSDQIKGNAGDDLVLGSDGNDILDGGTGSDVLRGGKGVDQINGGDDTDTAGFAGELSQYEIIHKSGSLSVRDLVGTDGTDAVIGVEILEFADGFVENGMFRPRFPDNHPPEIRTDAAICAEDAAVEIEVLSNDSDPDGDSLRVKSIGSPSFGTVALQANGAITYAPWPNRYGSDSFTYTVDDGRFGRSSGIVHVEVLPQPDSPVARADFSLVPPGDEVRIEVIRNDFDVDGEAVELLSVGIALNGTVAIDGDAVVYRANPAYSGEETVQYTISDGTGRSAIGSIRIVIGWHSADDGMMQLLMAAPEGSWVKINRNQFSDVWTPLAQRPTGYNNTAKILFAWSSMAWDPNRSQLIIWGGGHANYAGNEVYRFDARTRLWHRASLPSAVNNPLGDAQYFAVDGPYQAPIAAHTYDNQEFLPRADRFITFGGAKFNCCAKWVLLDGTTPTGPYLWDPSRAGEDMVGGTAGSHVKPGLYPGVLGGNMWENRDTLAVRGVGAVRPGKFVNGATAYADLGGRDSVFVAESPASGGRLFRYVINDLRDPKLDEWQLVGVRGRSGYADQGAGAYCHACGLFVRTALTSTAVPTLVAWDVTKAGPSNVKVNIQPKDVTGKFQLTKFHGMDFDERRGVFALWDGGPDVWLVSPGRIDDTESWKVEPALITSSEHAPAKSDGNLTVSGRTLESHGILGKWKYAPKYDVFLGVQNAVTGDVWAYKPVGWQPQL